MPAAGSEWTRYRRAPEVGGEAMAAHFVAHVYHRHSHDTYSFGVTGDGTQLVPADPVVLLLGRSPLTGDARLPHPG